VPGFDALGNDGQVQALTNAINWLWRCAVVGGAWQVGNEALIDFQGVDRQPFETQQEE